VKNFTLPPKFKDFEKWVADWSIPHEAGRFNKRVSSDMEDLNKFVRDLQAHIEAMIDDLNTQTVNDPDLLDSDHRRLFDLVLMWMEASIPFDLDWDVNDIEDAWPAQRLEFLQPSFFPDPLNRNG
jgi:hypothetical protein